MTDVEPDPVGQPDRAIWQRIRDALAADIAGGRYAPGDRLPSETALAARFGVHRHTLRRACAALAGAGLIHVRRGAGATVTGPVLAYPIGRRTRFSANLAAAGHVPGQRLLRCETVRALAAEAALLRLPVGAEVHLVESVRFADQVPILHARSLYPGARLPGFLAHLPETGSVTAALARCGIADYERAWTRIAAEPAPEDVARHLRLSPGAPLLRAESLNVAPDGTPVEYGLTLFAAERVELVIEGAATPVPG